MRAIVQAALDNHRHDPEFLRVLMEQAPRSRELMERFAEHEQERLSAMKELLAEHPEVCVDDKPMAARLVVTTVELVVHQLLSAPDPAAIPILENELVAMLTRYLSNASSPG